MIFVLLFRPFLLASAIALAERLPAFAVVVFSAFELDSSFTLVESESSDFGFAVFSASSISFIVFLWVTSSFSFFACFNKIFFLTHHSLSVVQMVLTSHKLFNNYH